MGKKRTHEQFIEEVKQLTNGEYKVLGHFTKMLDRIEIIHLKCGYKWSPKPNDFINSGSRCPKCAGNLKKTQEEFEEKVKELVGDEYTIIGNYVGNHIDVDAIHKTCGKLVKINPDRFINFGSRCKYCFGNLKMTHGEFILKINNINDKKYKILGIYKSRKKKIDIECIECGYKWSPTADALLKGHGCPKCAGNLKKTQEEFEEKIFALTSVEYNVIGKYLGDNEKVKIRHNSDKCNYYEWSPKANNFLNGSRCPICNLSKGESKIKRFLENNNIEFIPQKIFDGLLGLGNGNLSYDFYLEQYNLLIEYQGEFHDGSRGKYTKIKLTQQQEHDKRKKEYANNHNIKLLEIWYYDFDNIEQILNKELNILKLIKQVV